MRVKKALSRATAPSLKPIEPPRIPAKKNVIAAIEALEKVSDPKKVHELKSVTEAELEEIKKARPKNLSVEEKHAILEMYQLGYTTQIIAARLDRSFVAITRFLADYKPTTILAKAVFEANAEKLAYRVVRHADVEQSLEVMDRLKVLPKTAKDAGSGGSNFQIIVGGATAVSGQPSMPIPTQAEIIEAESEPRE